MRSRFASPFYAGLSLVLCASLLPSCSSGCGKAKETGKLQVATSIFPVYELTRRVAGEDADVALLLAPGHNEHHFDPTPKEVAMVAGARVGIMVGLGLDPWMEKLVKEASPKARLVKVGDRVPTLTIQEESVGEDAVHGDHHDEHDPKHADHDDDDEHHHEKGAVDPHVWLDPARARLIVKAIAEELARADVAHADGFRKRAHDFESVLDALDKETETRTATFSKRGFVTFHGSFGYFADRYKLKVLAVIEPFPGSTPSGKYVEEVLKVIKDKQVPALFSEPQLDARPAQTLAEAAHVPLGVLDPVGGGKETDTYEKMIRFNVASLEKVMR